MIFDLYPIINNLDIRIQILIFFQKLYKEFKISKIKALYKLFLGKKNFFYPSIFEVNSLFFKKNIKSIIQIQIKKVAKLTF